MELFNYSSQAIKITLPGIKFPVSIKRVKFLNRFTQIKFFSLRFISTFDYPTKKSALLGFIPRIHFIVLICIFLNWRFSRKSAITVTQFESGYATLPCRTPFILCNVFKNWNFLFTYLSNYIDTKMQIINFYIDDYKSKLYNPIYVASVV